MCKYFFQKIGVQKKHKRKNKIHPSFFYDEIYIKPERASFEKWKNIYKPSIFVGFHLSFVGGCLMLFCGLSKGHETCQNMFSQLFGYKGSQAKKGWESKNP